ncbi:hypothetical protein OEK97_28680, partial [Escherichia coli]|uniref:Clp protease N-terminal domain-containing protein n=1 Tax=Escherichia coli TaxID=562 RepID=UPI0021D8A7CB
ATTGSLLSQIRVHITAVNINQFTVKAQEAVVDSQAVALKRNHQSVEPEHLLFALLNQKDSLIVQCLDKSQVGLGKKLRA